MLLKKLIGKNYTSFSDFYVDFDNHNKSLVSGINNQDTGDSNGSGKSNFMGAIGWCVWGESNAEEIDYNVKLGESSCFVTVELEHDDKYCIITRSRDRERGLTTVDLMIDGIVSNGATVTATNRKIINLLRLDYTTFINSVYLRQNDLYSFADTKTNKDGRDILEKVLDLEEYDLYHEETKSKIKEIQKQIDLLEFSIEANKEIEIKKQQTIKDISEKISNHSKSLDNVSFKENELNTIKLEKEKFLEDKNKSEQGQYKINHLEDLINSQKNDINNLISRYNNTKTENVNKKSNLEKAIIEEGFLKSKQNELNDLILSNVIYEKQASELEITRNKLKTESSELAQKLMAINLDFRSLFDKIEEKTKSISKNSDNLNSPKIIGKNHCSECLTVITDETIDNFKNQLKLEIKQLTDDINDLKINLDKKENEKKSIETSINKYKLDLEVLESERIVLNKKILSETQINEKKKDLDSKFENIKIAKDDLERLNKSKDLENLKNDIDIKKLKYQEKQNELNQAKKDLEGLNIDFNKINAIEDNIENLSKEVDRLKQNSHVLFAEINNLRTSLENFDIIIKEVNIKKEELSNYKKTLSVYMQLLEAFSSKGIRADILQNAIEELERQSNLMLSRLTSKKLSVEFVTKKEVKTNKGEQVEKVVFKVLVHDSNRTLPFYMYSGGEKFRIAFVLRVALAQLLQRRANSKLEFLLIDEAFSSLDQNGVEKIIEVINELQKDFKLILVISHRNDVKQYFDQIITVVADETGSRII